MASSTATLTSSAQAKRRVHSRARSTVTRPSPVPCASGKAMQARKAMPPSVRHCAVRTTPDNRTLAKPKMSSSRSMPARGY